MGFRRDSLEGGGQFEELQEMPELREEILAADLQERDEWPRKVGAGIGVVITVAAMLINMMLCVGEGFAA